MPAHFVTRGNDGTSVIVPYFLKERFGGFLGADDGCHAMRAYGWLRLLYKRDGFLKLSGGVCMLVGVITTWDLL